MLSIRRLQAELCTTHSSSISSTVQHTAAAQALQHNTQEQHTQYNTTHSSSTRSTAHSTTQIPTHKPAILSCCPVLRAILCAVPCAVGAIVLYVVLDAVTYVMCCVFGLRCCVLRMLRVPLCCMLCAFVLLCCVLCHSSPHSPSLLNTWTQYFQLRYLLLKQR